MTVPARSVVDVPLTGLPPGAYAVVADADVPVVAAASVRIAGPPVGPLGRPPADVAWTAAAGSVDGEVLVALPRPGAAQPSGGAELVLTAGAADADVVVRRVGDHGEALARSDVHVSAGRTTVVAVPDAAAAALTIGRGQRVTAGVATLTADAAGTMLTLMPVGSHPAPGHDRLAAVADPWLPAQSSQSSSVP